MSPSFENIVQGEVTTKQKLAKQLKIRLKITRALNFESAHEVGRERSITVATIKEIEVGRLYFFEETHTGGNTPRGVVDSVSWTWHGKQAPGWVRRGDAYDKKKLTQNLMDQFSKIVAQKLITGSAGDFVRMIYSELENPMAHKQLLGGSSDFELLSRKQFEKFRGLWLKSSKLIYGSESAPSMEDCWIYRFSQRMVIDNGKTGEEYKALSDETRYFLFQMTRAEKILAIFEIPKDVFESHLL